MASELVNMATRTKGWCSAHRISLVITSSLSFSSHLTVSEIKGRYKARDELEER